MFSEQGYYESLLKYDYVDWFVEEVIKLEKKGLLFEKREKKILLWLKEMRNTIEKLLFVDFVKKKFFLIKLEIIVILLVNTGIQHIMNVILMSHTNKVFLFLS